MDLWKAGVNETDKFGYSPIIKSIIYKNDDVTGSIKKWGVGEYGTPWLDC